MKIIEVLNSMEFDNEIFSIGVRFKYEDKPESLRKLKFIYKKFIKILSKRRNFVDQTVSDETGLGPAVKFEAIICKEM